MGRPAKWSGPTAAIRVPAALADQLLEIARQLDGSNVQNSVAIATEQNAIALFNGPYLVTVDQARYLLDPPPVLVGEDAATVNQLVDELTAGLSEKELLLLFARLTEEWCKPIGEGH